jgi:Tol biopolymer transport system component
MPGTLTALLLLLAQAGSEEIERLGSEDPAVRERAENRLLDLGFRVEPLLRKALADGSPEVRARAERILRHLEPAILYINLGDVWATELRGMKPVRIANAELDIRGAWGRPDGRTVAFVVRDELRLRDLVTGEERPSFKLDGGVIDRFEWSPDGRRALVSASQPHRIYSLNVDTGEKTRPDIDLPWAREHVWSPDGTRIAVIDRDGGKDQRDVALLDKEGKLLRRVSKDGGSKSDLRWSGDGTKVAYVVTLADPTHPEGHSMNVAILNLETGALRSVTSDRRLLFKPSWSPDGGQIAFLRAVRLVGENPLAGNYDLCIARSDGGEVRVLRSGGITPETPAWSPEGRYILFGESSKDEQGTLCFTAGVIRPDGTDYKKIRGSDGSVHYVSWIPSRHLVK